MKLTVAHVSVFVLAAALLEVGQRTQSHTLSKIGLIALGLSSVLLLADLFLAGVESFRAAPTSAALE